MSIDSPLSSQPSFYLLLWVFTGPYTFVHGRQRNSPMTPELAPVPLFTVVPSNLCATTLEVKPKHHYIHGPKIAYVHVNRDPTINKFPELTTILCIKFFGDERNINY